MTTLMLQVKREKCFLIDDFDDTGLGLTSQRKKVQTNNAYFKATLSYLKCACKGIINRLNREIVAIVEILVTKSCT